jgi:hypothetical protein
MTVGKQLRSDATADFRGGMFAPAPAVLSVSG